MNLSEITNNENVKYDILESKINDFNSYGIRFLKAICNDDDMFLAAVFRHIQIADGSATDVTASIAAREYSTWIMHRVNHKIDHDESLTNNFESRKELYFMVNLCNEYISEFRKYPALKIFFITLKTTLINLNESICYKDALLSYRVPSRSKNIPKTFTYILQERGTNTFKIGKSQNIRERIKSLRTMSGRDIILRLKIEKDIESDLHAQFVRYRRIGEWFIDSSGEIENYINMNIQQDFIVDEE